MSYFIYKLNNLKIKYLVSIYNGEEEKGGNHHQETQGEGC